MNAKERRRVATLERRKAWIEQALADWRGGDIHRAKAEVGAIRWVLRIITRLEVTDPAFFEVLRAEDPPTE